MKYVMTWKKKQHGTIAEYEASHRRVLELMKKWRLPTGVQLHQFVVRAGTTGGYAVFETDDLTAVHEATAVFSAFNFHIDPVIDVDAALAAAGSGIEWRDAVV
jgi:Protein of unknown function (DUF3303)